VLRSAPSASELAGGSVRHWRLLWGTGRLQKNTEEERRFLTTDKECQQAYTTVASEYLNKKTGLMDVFHNARDLPLSESLIVRRGSVTSNGEKDRAQSWMAAITFRVNSL